MWGQATSKTWHTWLRELTTHARLQSLVEHTHLAFSAASLASARSWAAWPVAASVLGPAPGVTCGTWWG